MSQFMQVIAIVAVIYTALSALCFSMEKHYQDVFSGEPLLTHQRLLYWGGWSLLAISAILAITLWGTAIGFVGWLGCLTAIQMTVIIVLTYTKISKISIIISLFVSLVAIGGMWLLA